MNNINETFNSLLNFNNCCLESNVNLENIPKNKNVQQVAQTIEQTLVYPSPQPYLTAPKAPLVYTKMLDPLLESIYTEFVTNPKIIRLFDAFNYNTQMTIQQYDSIIQACILFWSDKNFELFQQDTKLFFNFYVVDYLGKTFYCSYKKYVQNNTNLITDVNDPNLGANGYTQWLGCYINSRVFTGSNNSRCIAFPSNTSVSSFAQSAFIEGQIYVLGGISNKNRKLITTFDGKPGVHVNFQFSITELDTTVTETTEVLPNGNTLVKITESNVLGQTKISSTETDKNGNIVSINVDYVNGLTWNIVNNIDFD